MKKILNNTFTRFGIIGGLGFVLELFILNAWMFITSGGPLIANTFATIVAILFNWWANRNYNFEKTEKSKKVELMQFFVASLSGLLISNLLLWGVYYGLGLTSILVINATKVVGLIAGAVIKFFLYKKWVFASR
jgi:putative flippase GtrA